MRRLSALGLLAVAAGGVLAAQSSAAGNPPARTSADFAATLTAEPVM